MAAIIYVFVKDRREGDSHSLFSVSDTYLFKWPFLSRNFPGKTATETYFLTLMINSSPCIVWLFRGLSIYMLSFWASSSQNSKGGLEVTKSIRKKENKLKKSKPDSVYLYVICKLKKKEKKKTPFAWNLCKRHHSIDKFKNGHWVLESKRQSTNLFFFFG